MQFQFRSTRVLHTQILTYMILFIPFNALYDCFLIVCADNKILNI